MRAMERAMEIGAESGPLDVERIVEIHRALGR
jgi:hypothetical protein